MAARITARNKTEFEAIVKTYLAEASMTVRKLSAFSLGSADTLPRYFKDPAAEIHFGSVDKVLTFIENNPAGVK